MIPVDPWVPLGAAILAFHNGHHQAVIRVDSDVFDTEDVSVRHYYRPENDPLPDLDGRALDRCKGKVLDVGAGAGRHALELQHRGLEVTGLDISNDSVLVMQERGIRDARQGDVFSTGLNSYDTILLLMNGIGLAGNLDGLEKLMRRFKQLLRPGGNVVFDASGLDAVISQDGLDDVSGFAFGKPQLGEVYFRLTFDDLQGSWYPWLFPSSSLLAESASAAGFDFATIGRGSRGAFLACIHQK